MVECREHIYVATDNPINALLKVYIIECDDGLAEVEVVDSKDTSVVYLNESGTDRAWVDLGYSTVDLDQSTALNWMEDILSSLHVLNEKHDVFEDDEIE